MSEMPRAGNGYVPAVRCIALGAIDRSCEYVRVGVTAQVQHRHREARQRRSQYGCRRTQPRSRRESGPLRRRPPDRPVALQLEGAAGAPALRELAPAPDFRGTSLRRRNHGRSASLQLRFLCPRFLPRSLQHRRETRNCHTPSRDALDVFRRLQRTLTCSNSSTTARLSVWLASPAGLPHPWRPPRSSTSSSSGEPGRPARELAAHRVRLATRNP